MPRSGSKIVEILVKSGTMGGGNVKIKPNTEFMLLALREAEKNLSDMRGGPFGACIVKGGRVIAVGRNTVIKQDASRHRDRLLNKKLY